MRFKKIVDLNHGHLVNVKTHYLSDESKGEAKKLYELLDGPYIRTCI